MLHASLLAGAAPVVVAFTVSIRPTHPPAGEAILSPEVAELAGSACLLEPLGGGNARLLQARLQHAGAVGKGSPCQYWVLRCKRQAQTCLPACVNCRPKCWELLKPSPITSTQAHTTPPIPPSRQVLEPYQLTREALQEAEGTTSLERAARQVARERAALAALPEPAQGHALQVCRAQERALVAAWKAVGAGPCSSSSSSGTLRHPFPCMPALHQPCPAPLPLVLQLLRMHLLENVRVRVEAGHIDYVNELRWAAAAAAAAAAAPFGLYY